MDQGHPDVGVGQHPTGMAVWHSDRSRPIGRPPAWSGGRPAAGASRNPWAGWGTSLRGARGSESMSLRNKLRWRV